MTYGASAGRVGQAELDSGRNVVAKQQDSGHRPLIADQPGRAPAGLAAWSAATVPLAAGRPTLRQAGTPPNHPHRLPAGQLRHTPELSGDPTGRETDSNRRGGLGRAWVPAPILEQVGGQG